MMEKERPIPIDANNAGQNDGYVTPSRLDIINDILVNTYDTGAWFQNLLAEKQRLENEALPPNIGKNE